MCIDAGDTEIRYGVLDENELFLTKDKIPTEAFKGGPSLLKKAMGIIREYLKLQRVGGIYVSTAGVVDMEKGEIFYSAPLIPDYTDTKIKVRMESEFGLPYEVEDDVNCAGPPEAVSGATAGSRSTLCLTVGTGIGGYVIIDRDVYHGFDNNAREVGYMHMEGSDFQTLGAASILASEVTLAKGEPVRIWNGLRVLELTKAGDSACTQAIDDMCDVLGKGISNICYMINPQVVVLGRGVMTQEKYLRPKIQAAMDQYPISSVWEKTALTFAQHGNGAGVRGAYYHFKERQG